MSRDPDEMNRLNEENKTAWNSLYADSHESVWGKTPLPFLENWRETFQEYTGEQAEILDAATGEGRNLSFILALGGQVSASDAASAGLERIPYLLRQQVSLFENDLEKLPFADDQFHLIFLLDTLETLPRPRQVLRELARVLHPKGGLFLNLPDPDESIANIEMQELKEGEGKLYRGSYFYHFFSALEARQLMRECGLSVVQESEERWTESPHPGFREAEHEHFSHVFLCRKHG